MLFSFMTPTAIRFGRGSSQAALPDLAALGQRVLLCRAGSARFADQVTAQHVVTHRGEPTLADLDRVISAGRDARVDAVVAVGGGSVIDLGKAVAALIPASDGPLAYLEGVGEGRALDATPLPFAALPTAAGTGAEVTKNAVIDVGGRKVSLRDDRMLADLAIVDPVLMDNAPREVTATAGMDALVQVIEPYLSIRANPMTDALCRHAIPLGLSALALLMEHEDKAARDDMALVSLMGGLALANAGLGVVHGLAGVTGGVTGAPHGLICARLLPGALRLNRGLAKDTRRYDEVEGWIGARMGPLETAFESWGLPSLARYLEGHDPVAIATTAQSASSMKANPHPLSVDQIAGVLTGAG